MKKFKLTIAGLMLAMLLGGYSTATAQNVQKFDLNGDGAVDVADMSALIGYMAGARQQGAQFLFRKQTDATKLGESAGKAVDLGLPSGRQWADKNLGYSKDPDFGAYFAWGGRTWVAAKGTNVDKGYVLEAGTMLEDKKTAFTWSNYEWSEGSTWKDVNKYTVKDGTEDAWWYSYGTYGNSTFRGDEKDVLEAEDDAASFHWGGKWRMPYAYEFQELLEYTDQYWDTDKKELQSGKSAREAKGVFGCWFRGKNPGRDGLDWSKYEIFLPAAGDIEYQYVEYRIGQYMFPRGKYWSKEHEGHFGHQPTSMAAILSINRKHCCENEADNYISFYERQYGLSIRPVLGDE